MTHAHALAQRQVQIAAYVVDRLEAVDLSALPDNEKELEIAKRCVAAHDILVATTREAELLSLEGDDAVVEGGEEGSMNDWECVPLVLHECVPPGFDAVQVAVDMNCDRKAKSNFTAVDGLTGRGSSGIADVNHLAELRQRYGANLNINGLDLNCNATRIDGMTVTLSDFMLGESSIAKSS